MGISMRGIYTRSAEPMGVEYPYTAIHAKTYSELLEKHGEHLSRGEVLQKYELKDGKIVTPHFYSGFDLFLVTVSLSDIKQSSFPVLHLRRLIRDGRYLDQAIELQDLGILPEITSGNWRRDIATLHIDKESDIFLEFYQVFPHLKSQISKFTTS
jgi:hypothetical protein